MPIEIATGLLAAAFAILGAVMSLHPPTRRKAKAWYLVGCMGLGAGGIWIAIVQYRQRVVNEARSDQAQQTLTKTLAELHRSTTALQRSEEDTKRLQGLNTRLQYQLLAQSKDIVQLSTSTLNSLTGKDSYAYVVPQDHSASEEGVPLAISNAGPNILSGISIRIMRTTTAADFNSDAIDGPEIAVATLYPDESRVLTGRRILPRFTDGNSTDDYWLHISTQSGLISQMISFRRRADRQLLWAYSMTVARVAFKKDPSGGVSSTTTPLFVRGWTDEPSPTKK